MGKINRNKKFMSTLLIGTSAASLAASNTANTSSAQISGLFSSIGKKVFDLAKIGVDGVKSSEGFHLVQKGFNFLKPYLNSTAKIIKAPWSAYKWVTFDMVPKAFSPTVGLGGEINPAEILVRPFVGLSAAALWLAIQAAMVSAIGGSIYLFYRSIGYKKLKNKISELKNKYGEDKYVFCMDELFVKEDSEFIQTLKGKYGEDYSKKLEKEYREKVLESMLENKDRPEKLKNCKTYFENIFVVNNPESDKYFNQNKDDPEKDYGLIGPNKLSSDDLKFIDEELPKMKDEIKFLKEKKTIKNDEDVIKDVRNFIAECYHFYNKNKSETFLDGRMWFLCFYMNGVRNIDEIKKINNDLASVISQFVCIGSDFSVEKNWYNKEKNYGLLNDDLDYACKMLKGIKDVQSKRISKGLINLVEDEEYNRYIKILSTNENSAEKVKDAFRKYVFYLHKCNKEIKKAEKGFDYFLKEKNVKT